MIPAMLLCVPCGAGAGVPPRQRAAGRQHHAITSGRTERKRYTAQTLCNCLHAANLPLAACSFFTLCLCVGCRYAVLAAGCFVRSGIFKRLALRRSMTHTCAGGTIMFTPVFTPDELEKYAEVLLWGLKRGKKSPLAKSSFILVRYHLPALPLAEE